MRGSTDEVCGCFPTGRHYPGLAEAIAEVATARVVGLASEFPAPTVWAAASLALIDFETTGLDPEQDRIIEIGIVTFVQGELRERRNWLVNPGIPVPEEARNVHGITDQELAAAPPFDEVLPELVSMLGGRMPAAYNAEFDRRFLHAEAGRVAFDYDGDLPPALRDEVHWIDPLVWVRELHKDEKGKKLVDACQRLGIALEQAHRAAGDAEAAGRVLLALAPQMPRTYGELIRIQAQYFARQDVDLAAMWRSRRGL